MSINYFPHDTNAGSDNKIAMMRFKYGNEGYGLYWLLVEMLYLLPDHRYPISSDLSWESLSMQLHSKINIKEFIIDCVELFVDDAGSLFSFDGCFFWSEEVYNRVEKISDISAKRKEAIKKRWEKKKDTNVIQMKYNCNTNVCKNDTIVIQNDTNINKNKKENINKNKKENINKNKENIFSSKLPAKTEKKEKLNASLSNQDLTGVVEYFNLKCDRLPKVVKLTEARKTKLKNRINEFGLDGINTLFNKVSESNFLNGESGWKASFDWIIDSETKVAKILEGHYDNKEKPSRFDDCKRLYERLDKEEREGEQEGNVKAIELDKSFLS